MRLSERQITDYVVEGQSNQPGHSYSRGVSQRGYSECELLVSVLRLLGYPEEGVDVGSSSQQSLPEYHDEDERQSTFSRQAPVDGLEGEEEEVDRLQDRQKVDPLDLETGERGPGDQDP